MATDHSTQRSLFDDDGGPIGLVKTCCRCKERKPLSQFNRSAAERDGIGWRCKPCQQEARKESEAKKPDKHKAGAKNRQLGREKHGCTLKQYKVMHADQKGLCAICQLPRRANTTSPHMCVDHCHETGKIRGLLCRACNTGLGCFDDSPERMIQAMFYLARASGQWSRLAEALRAALAGDQFETCQGG